MNKKIAHIFKIVKTWGFKIMQRIKKTIKVKYKNLRQFNKIIKLKFILKIFHKYLIRN